MSTPQKGKNHFNGNWQQRTLNKGPTLTKVGGEGNKRTHQQGAGHLGGDETQEVLAGCVLESAVALEHRKGESLFIPLYLNTI